MASLLGGGEPEGAQRAEEVLAELVANDDPEVRAETARALGQVAAPTASDVVVQLLYDRDLAVVRAAIGTVRLRFDRGGPNPLYATILISLMANRRLKHEARDALVAQGESAVEQLLLFMKSPDEQIWVRRAMPKTIALIGIQSGADALIENIDASDAMLRSKIIEALVYLTTRNDEISFQRPSWPREAGSNGEKYPRERAERLRKSIG